MFSSSVKCGVSSEMPQRDRSLGAAAGLSRTKAAEMFALRVGFDCLFARYGISLEQRSRAQDLCGSIWNLYPMMQRKLSHLVECCHDVNMNAE